AADPANRPETASSLSHPCDTTAPAGEPCVPVDALTGAERQRPCRQRRQHGPLGEGHLCTGLADLPGMDDLLRGGSPARGAPPPPHAPCRPRLLSAVPPPYRAGTVQNGPLLRQLARHGLPLPRRNRPNRPSRPGQGPLARRPRGADRPIRKLSAVSPAGS